MIPFSSTSASVESEIKPTTKMQPDEAAQAKSPLATANNKTTMNFGMANYVSYIRDKQLPVSVRKNCYPEQVITLQCVSKELYSDTKYI